MSSVVACDLNPIPLSTLLTKAFCSRIKGVIPYFYFLNVRWDASLL
jgi:hypothetical protein